MDRNFPCFGIGPPVVVALRKESVDRNLPVLQSLTYGRWSLSARRAWIEILVHRAARAMLGGMSLSARRAWIEISEEPYTRWFGPVALRKESVDRNIADYAKPEWLRVALRKESVDRNRPGVPIPGPGGRSLSARRAWIEISAMAM